MSDAPKEKKKGKPQHISIGPANESSFVSTHGVGMHGHWVCLTDPRTGVKVKHFIPETMSQ